MQSEGEERSRLPRPQTAAEKNPNLSVLDDGWGEKSARFDWEELELIVLESERLLTSEKNTNDSNCRQTEGPKTRPTSTEEIAETTIPAQWTEMEREAENKQQHR